MDHATLRLVLVIALFAGVFIVVPIIYTLARLQIRMASITSQRAGTSGALEERVSALEQEVERLRLQQPLNGKASTEALPSDLHARG